MNVAAALRRVALTVSLAGLLVLSAGGPALAHGRGADATNYRSAITSEPTVPGLTWRVYGGDELLAVRVEGDLTVEIPGYQEEPYLRITPEGVWRNSASPATYLNEDRYAMVDHSEHASADAAPEWEQVSDEPFYAWHDHRIHWMSPELPAQVGDGSEERLVQPWEVEFLADGAGHTLTGELWWIPSPSPWPWLAAGLALSLPALAGVRTRARDDIPDDRGGRWPGLTRPAGVVLGVISLAGIVRVIDDVTAIPLTTGEVLWAAGQTLLFTGVGLFGAVRAWRGEYGDVIALAFGSAAIAFGQGIVMWPALVSSQLATVLPEWFTRLSIAASITQLLPVGAVVALGYRRLVEMLPTAEPEITRTGAADGPGRAEG